MGRITANSYRIITIWHLPGVRKELISPVGIRFSLDGKTAFVALGRANRVAVIDVAALKVVRSVTVGRLPWGLVIKP